MISRRVRPRVALAHRVDLARRRRARLRAAPCRSTAPTLCTRLRPLARAASCSCSMRARADAARREVDDAQEAGVVVRVLDQAQVGQRVLDLGALEEAQAAVHLVRHAGVEQRALDHPALRVAAVEHRDLAARRCPRGAAAALSSTNHCASAKSVGASYTRTGSPGPASVRRFLPRRRRVVRDQLVGGVEDVAVASGSSLQLDDGARRGTRARTPPCCRPARRGRRRCSGRRRRPRTRAARARRPANIFSHAYCSLLVSWNSSTRMWRKRRW